VPQPTTVSKEIHSRQAHAQAREEAKKLLDFEKHHIENPFIKKSKIPRTPAETLWWSVKCERIGLAGLSLDDVVPDLMEYCDLLQHHCSKWMSSTEKDGNNDDDIDLDDLSKEAYCVIQILLISKYLDMSDEAGRQRLLLIVRSLLCEKDTPNELLEPSLACWKAAQRNMSNTKMEACIGHVEFIAGCIQEVHARGQDNENSTDSGGEEDNDASLEEQQGWETKLQEVTEKLQELGCVQTTVSI
jgi:hypothetical protein